MQSSKLFKIITKENPDFDINFDTCNNTVSSYKGYQIDHFNKIETGIMHDENEKLGIFYWKDNILIMHDYINLNKNNLEIYQQYDNDKLVTIFYLSLKKR